MEHVNNYKTIITPFKRAAQLAWKWDPFKFSLLCFLSALLGASAYAQYASFSQIVNDIINLQKSIGTRQELMNHSVVLLITFFIPSALRQLQQFVFVHFRFKYLRELSLLSTEEQAKKDIATIESTKFQDLMVKANSRGIAIIYQVVEQGIRNIENVSGIIVASIFIFTISPVLFLVALITGAPSFYFYKRYGTQVWWIWDLNPKNRRKYFNVLNLFFNIGSLVEIKLFNLKSKFQTEAKDLLETFDGELLKIEKKKFGYQFLILMLEILGISIVVWFLVKNGIEGTIAIGTLLLAFNSYRGLYNTFQSFFIVLGYQDEMGKYATWWFDIFDLKPSLIENPQALKPEWRIPPIVKFENVSFKYDESDKVVLHDISFTLEPGQKIALVGLNGAGKTSLVKLLCREYDPTSGRIMVNDVNLRDIDLEYWQSKLGVLFQDFTDFKLTVAESIGLGNSNRQLDREKIVEAAKKATANTFIEKYPKQYDQLLWKGFDDGVLPSKGERQKIAVARIFYRDALISILDEPTSAIDAPSEDKIFEELESLSINRTAILISHRMSAIKNADRIMVLKDGKIVEQGKHAELMKLKGEYCMLFTTQSKRMFEEVSSN